MKSFTHTREGGRREREGRAEREGGKGGDSHRDTKSYIKVTMNKLCARLFIIIFMMYTRKSEYIPTVTNFASILANYFYFLPKITALQPSVLNFRGRLVKF